MNETYPSPENKNAKTLAWLEENLTPSDTFKKDQRHFDLKNVIPLARSEGAGHGIESSVFGVVKAGAELFGVIAVRKDGKVSFVLSRYREGKRGQLVGVISDGEPRIDRVGIDAFKDRGDEADSSLSPGHFSIHLEDGTLKVTDNGSEPGTQLFARLVTDIDAEEPVPADSPICDGGWLPTSHDLKDYV